MKEQCYGIKPNFHPVPELTLPACKANQIIRYNTPKNHVN